MRPAIRERRRSERRSDDRRFRTILSADADGVVVVDADGIICYANPAAEAMLGRSARVLVGELFGYPLVAGTTTELNLVRASDAGPAVVEMRVVETEWDGRPALLASLRDVTDRRRAEAERAARLRAEAKETATAEALRDRDAFLALAAHELKTPLTRMALLVQDALRRLPGRTGREAPDRARDALLLVDRETAHLARLVNHMLDLARIEGGTFTLDRRPTDLRELVVAVVERTRSTADARVSVVLPDAPLMVPIDASAIGSIATSLVAGAVRQGATPAAVDVELAREEGGARLTVRDHAGPIPADARAALADPSLSVVEAAAATSAGVAVHAARRIVELHGGSVALDFPDDGGTRVSITLPT